MTKTFFLAASLAAAIAAPAMAGDTDGPARSNMYLLDEPVNRLEQPARRDVQTPARGWPITPLERKRPAIQRSLTQESLAMRKMRTEVYRVYVTMGINAELKRLSCFKSAINRLHGAAFDAALERYARRTGSRTDAGTTPSMLLAELIAQNDDLCFRPDTSSAPVRYAGDSRQIQAAAPEARREQHLALAKTPLLR